MAGKIVKAKNQTNFVQMHNDIARSPLLSMKAKAMLLVLLSLPENWVIHISQLEDFFKESKTAVRNSFNELRMNGFILSVQSFGKDGKFRGRDYVVYAESQTYIELAPTSPKDKINYPEDGVADGEIPHTKKPYTENPNAVKRDSENKTLQINTVTNKDETKKNNTKHTIHNSENIFFDFSVDDIDHMIGMGEVVSRNLLTEEQHNGLTEMGYLLDDQQNYYYPE